MSNFTTKNIEGVLNRVSQRKGYVHEIDAGVITVSRRRSFFGIGDRLHLSELEITNDEGTSCVIVPGRIKSEYEGKKIRLEIGINLRSPPSFYSDCKLLIDGKVVHEYQLTSMIPRIN